MAKKLLRSYWRRSEGATALEFALVCVPLLILTLGIIEFAFALFQWNTAEKATQLGVRRAVVSAPVATGLNTFNGKTNSNEYGDEPMPDFANSPVICNGATSTCSNGFTYSSAAHGRIVARMRSIFPRIAANNVVVEYQPMGLGFVGRCGAVPSVTVRLQNMSYDFMVIDSLLNLVGGTGAASMAMPSFTATMVGEDLNTAGAISPCA
ncbi:MAG: pilus assembly protein [Alphaproteobacteria bacterium]|nr:pilus assembly protein [Alphaproteobacteria bacterium]